MKKLLFMFAGLALLFTACNMAIPESVSVKTDADYNFSIGDIKKDFNDTFEVSQLFDGLETDANKIYDYFPEQENEKLQQFILTVATPAIPLSINIPSGVDITGKSLADLSIPSFTASASVNIDMNLKEMFESFKVLGDEFAEKVAFSELPLYVYCNIGTGFESVAMKGRIIVTSAKGSKYIVGDNTGLVPFSLASAPALKNASGDIVTPDSDDTVVTDVSKEKCTAQDKTNMTAFLNENKDTEDGFTLTYDIELDADGTVFDGDSIGDINLTIYLALPLKFKVDSTDGSPLNIDLISLAKKEKTGTDKDKDIFNRDKATDVSDMQKYLDIIEKVVISYKNKKNPFVADKSSFIIESKVPSISKDADINQDTVTVTHYEFMLMLETYPYSPTVALQIADDSTVALPRDIALDMNVALLLATNGTIKF